jgi:hypothetical protein
MKPQSKATKARDLPGGRRRVLLTIAEISAVASLCAIVNEIVVRSVFAGNRPTTVGFWPALSRILLTNLVLFVLWVGPLVAGYFYGWRRKRQLTFVVVMIGWAIGLIVSHLLVSVAWSVLGFANIHAVHNVKAHNYHVPTWLNWTIWILWYAAFSSLPSLAAMKGQKRRLVASALAASESKVRAKR